MHAEIAARRQRRCAHLWRIEWLAGLFDESVKPSLRQQFLQAIVEHVSRRARHLSPCHEEVALKLTFTPHRHRCHPFRIFNLHTESGKPNFVNGLLKGLRVYLAEGDRSPAEVPPPPSPRKYWTRRGIAEWLVEKLAEDVPPLIGIDHGFSFPLRYFEFHHLPPDWQEFLDDFQRHWPTDEDIYVDFVRDGLRGARWC